MRKSHLPKSAEPSGEIDLTPMLDVVFIMLIFFIVTATFIKEPGIDVNRPIALTGQSISNQSILIAISENNEIWMDNVLLKEHQISARIEQIKSANIKSVLVIQADAKSTADKLALVIDAAKKAGITDISLATDE